MASSISFILPLLGACICLSLVTTLALLEQIQHTPKSDGLLNFLVVGDWGRKGAYNQSEVARQMGVIGAKLDIDFVISTGDNFYRDGLSSIKDPAFQESFTKIYTAKSLQKRWYSVLGNHDYHRNAEAELSYALKKLDWRWHCLRSFYVKAGVADIFFVDTTAFVNQYFDDPKNHTFDWKGVKPRNKYLSNLLEDLRGALNKSRASWKIVVGHHAIKSIGPHGDTQEIKNYILPILKAYKVDMYINGHDHCLQHIGSRKSRRIQYLTSGGGSKAWSGEIHYGVHKHSLQFYYDGQGFMSAKFRYSKANIAFHDVFGKTLHHFQLHANSTTNQSIAG